MKIKLLKPFKTFSYLTLFTALIYSLHAVEPLNLDPNISLKDQASLNQLVALKTQQIYTYLNETKAFRLPVDAEPQTTPEGSHWQIVKSQAFYPPLQRFIFVHTLTSDNSLKPSAAINNLFKHYDKPFVLGCEVVAYISILSCVLEALTPEVFDDYFSQGLSIKSDTSIQFLKITPEKRAPNALGEFGYFMNTIRYVERHPKGNSTGHNVFCVGFNKDNQPLYHGIGMTFSEGPQPLDKLQEILRQDFLAPPTEAEKDKAQESDDCKLVLKIAADPKKWAGYLNYHQEASPYGVGVLDLNKLRGIRENYFKKNRK